MKKSLRFLPLIFVAQQALAGVSVPDVDDKTVCRFNNDEVILKTTAVSPNNPEYWKEAELMPDVKIKFAQRYRYYGMRTYNFKLVDGKKMLAFAETVVEGENSIFVSHHPTLSLATSFTKDGKEYMLLCDFIIDGNKSQE